MAKNWKQTPEAKLKIGLASLGRKVTDETRKKISLGMIGRKISIETRLKISKARTGMKFSEEHKKKIGMAKKGKPSPWAKGHPKGQKLSEETKRKISIANSNGCFFGENTRLRKTYRYKEWRKKVFERDKWMCIWCGTKSNTRKDKKGKYIILNADHIKPFAQYPELRFDINNGRTLCEECHSKTDTYKGKNSKYARTKRDRVGKVQ